jgi:hypothetical protein
MSFLHGTFPIGYMEAPNSADFGYEKPYQSSNRISGVVLA